MPPWALGALGASQSHGVGCEIACSAHKALHHSRDPCSQSGSSHLKIIYTKNINCKQHRAKKNTWTYGSQNDLILNSQGDAKLSFRKSKKQTDKHKQKTWLGPNPTQASRSSSAVTCAAQKSTAQGKHPMDGHCCHQEQDALCLPSHSTHSSPCSLPGYFSQKSLNPAQVLDVKCRITSPELNHWLL